MPGPINTPTPDIASVIDAAVNGTDPNAPIGPPAPTAADQPNYGLSGQPRTQQNAVLSSLFDLKGPPIKTDNIGKPTTKNPLTGLDAPNPYPTYRYWWKDGSYVDVATDPQGGHVVGGPALQALDPKNKAPTVYGTGASEPNVWVIDPQTGQPKIIGQNPSYQGPTKQQQPAIYGTGANEPNVWTVDPQTGQPTVLGSNPSYQNPANQPLTPYEQQAAATAQTNAQTARGNLLDAQSRTALLASQQYFEDQVAAGKMSDDQAAQQFKQVFDIFTANQQIAQTAQQAGRDAVAAAQASNANRVGPGFGANFSRGLQGVTSGNPSMVNYGPSDFTYPTPDYQAIAAKAQAAVTSRLAQYAGALGQQNAAYRSSAVPAYQPPVLTQAAISATSAPGSGGAPPPPTGYMPPQDH